MDKSKPLHIVRPPPPSSSRTTKQARSWRANEPVEVALERWEGNESDVDGEPFVERGNAALVVDVAARSPHGVPVHLHIGQ